MIKIKFPSKKSKKFLENFFIQKKLDFIIQLSRRRRDGVSQMNENEKYFKDMQELQDNFNKQVYLIITLQENLKKTLHFGKCIQPVIMYFDPSWTT